MAALEFLDVGNSFLRRPIQSVHNTIMNYAQLSHTVNWAGVLYYFGSAAWTNQPTNRRIVCWLMIWPSKFAVALLTEISTAAFLDRRYTVVMLTAMKCTVPKKSMHALVHAFRRRLRIYASICTIPPAILVAASLSPTRPHRTCTGNSNFVIIFTVP